MNSNDINSPPCLVLDNSEQLFEMVFSQQFQYMATLSLEGQVLGVNDLALTFQGIEKVDYIGKSFWTSSIWSHSPEWEKIWKQRLIDASDQQKTIVVEYAFKMQDGSICYADISTTPIYPVKNNNQLSGYVIQVIDTTERHNTQNKQQGSDTKLALVLEQTHIGNWSLNLVDQTTNRSLTHDQIFGYDSLVPDWTYQTFLQHVLPEEKDEVDNKLQQAMASQNNWHIECRIRRKDGEIRWILASGGHTLDVLENTKLIVGIVQDITDLKQAEEANLRHNAELKSLFNALPDTYFRVTSDGNILDYHTQNKGDFYSNRSDFIGKYLKISGLFSNQK